MRKAISVLALAAMMAAPVAALADTVDPTLIPDGTYTVKVEKVIDAKHMQVKMDNGVETQLTTAKATIDFSKLNPNDSVMMSISKGNVLVMKKLG